MPTATASGSGEPPERSDYDAHRTLPRSGLLELCIAAEQRPAHITRKCMIVFRVIRCRGLRTLHSINPMNTRCMMDTVEAKLRWLCVL
jgi:hypothetical protein